MAAPKFKKNNVEQKINLQKLFGKSFKGNSELKDRVGQAIIDKIRERTASGDGKLFDAKGNAKSVRLESPYSDAYAGSGLFKAFGKKQGKINMTLRGDMLGLMDIKKQTEETITLGWDDKTENNKAFNHSTGDTVPRRPFFGISKKELKEIREQFKDEIEEIDGEG